MKTKTIKLKQKYLIPFTSLEDVENEKNLIITNICKRFKNETNLNTMQYALDVLDGYRYVPSDTCIPEGRYIRYIDCIKPLDLKLRLGGFVTNCTEYTLCFINQDKFFKVKKNHCIVFMLLEESDKLHSILNKI